MLVKSCDLAIWSPSTNTFIFILTIAVHNSVSSQWWNCSAKLTSSDWLDINKKYAESSQSQTQNFIIIIIIIIISITIIIIIINFNRYSSSLINRSSAFIISYYLVTFPHQVWVRCHGLTNWIQLVHHPKHLHFYLSLGPSYRNLASACSGFPFLSWNHAISVGVHRIEGIHRPGGASHFVDIPSKWRGWTLKWPQSVESLCRETLCDAWPDSTLQLIQAKTSYANANGLHYAGRTWKNMMQFLFRFKTHLPAACCANLGLSSNFQAEVDGEFQLRSCQIMGPPLYHSNSANEC